MRLQVWFLRLAGFEKTAKAKYKDHKNLPATFLAAEINRYRLLTRLFWRHGSRA
jgi:hypothetical protein